MATPGTIISATGHVGLIGWLILGWGFEAEPLPFEIQDVQLISASAFEAATGGGQPAAEDAAPEPPVTPEPAGLEPPPEPAPEETALPEPPQPDPRPETDPAPAEADDPAPRPVTEPAPEGPLQPEILPAANPEVGDSPRPVPRDAPRVATEAAPEPEAETDFLPQEAVAEAETPEAAELEEQPALAEEAATTEIPLEDETPEAAEVITVSSAPERSRRPAARPTRPEPAAAAEAPEPEPEPAPDPEPEPEPQTRPEPDPEPDTSVEDLLAGLQAEEARPAVDPGPPLTRGERDGLQLAVQRCWALPLSTDAQSTVVEVSFELSREGVPSNISLVSANGRTDEANRAAFEAARRAIQRCAQGGYRLPAEKYEQWRRVVITFNPERMAGR